MVERHELLGEGVAVDRDDEHLVDRRDVETRR